MGLNSERFNPICWHTSTDIPIPVDQRDLNPSDTINEVWQQLEAALDDDDDDGDDDMFDVYKKIQKRILEAIIQGLAQFDAEYAWEGLDRSRFLLLAFICGGDPKLNLYAAKKLNPVKLYQEFKNGYAPGS
jgi:hypothetical protein